MCADYNEYMGSSGAPAPVPRVVDRFFDFSLLGMLAAGYFAVVGSGYLDWPTATLTLLGLCLRGLMVAGVVEFEFSNRLVAAITLAYILFYPVDYFFVSASFVSAYVSEWKEWNGMEWNGMEWNGMEWNGMER